MNITVQKTTSLVMCLCKLVEDEKLECLLRAIGEVKSIFVWIGMIVKWYRVDWYDSKEVSLFDVKDYGGGTFEWDLFAVAGGTFWTATKRDVAELNN